MEPPSIAERLEPADRARWEEYLELERRGRRREALALLRALTRSVRGYPPERRAAFARALCEAVADRGEEIPFRQPLFAEVVWPSLLTEYRAGSAAAARWMVSFYRWLPSLPGGRELFLEPEFTERRLLREALRRDPADRRARRMLLGELARSLDFAVHEVPWAVLSGMDGASAEDCAFLMDLTDEAEELARAEGLLEGYAEALAEWRFHFEHYPRYLARRREYGGYADYLSREGGVSWSGGPSRPDR